MCPEVSTNLRDAQIQSDIARSMQALVELRQRLRNPPFCHPARSEWNFEAREIFEEHLRLAEKHIATAKMNIEKQRDLVKRLGRHVFAEPAKDLLAQFEVLQALHIAHRAWLIRELSELE